MQKSGSLLSDLLLAHLLSSDYLYALCLSVCVSNCRETDMHVCAYSVQADIASQA